MNLNSYLVVADLSVKGELPLQIFRRKLTPRLSALTPHAKGRDPPNSYGQEATSGVQALIPREVVLSTLRLLDQPRPCLPHSPPCLNLSWDLAVPGTWQPLPTTSFFFFFFCPTCFLAKPAPTLLSRHSLCITFYGSFPWTSTSPVIKSPNPWNSIGKLLTIVINYWFMWFFI